MRRGGPIDKNFMFFAGFLWFMFLIVFLMTLSILPISGSGPMGIIDLALIVILLVILIYIPLYFIFRKFAFDEACEEEAFVSVIGKATRTTGGRYGVRTIYYVSFSFPDGARKNFTVDVDAYNTLQENDIGVLIYKENGKHLFFIDFEHRF